MGTTREGEQEPGEQERLERKPGKMGVGTGEKGWLFREKGARTRKDGGVNQEKRGKEPRERWAGTRRI